MKMTDFMLFKDDLFTFSTILQDWIPKDATIIFATTEKYICTLQSKHHLHLKLEEDLREDSIAAKVIKTKSKTEVLLDSSIFGEQFPTVGYPIHIDGQQAALILVLPSSFRGKREPYKFLTGKQDDDWAPIPINEVSHIESLQKRTWFYTMNDKYKSNITLKELQTRLPDDFIRIHRSYILNLYFVKKVTKDIASNFIVVLKNNVELPVSQSYINELKKVLEL